MQCIHSRRLQHTTHVKGQIHQTENKDTEALNNILEQMDLIDIYRTLHPKATGYTFFSSAHGTFSRIDHILAHKKASLNSKILKFY